MVDNKGPRNKAQDDAADEGLEEHAPARAPGEGEGATAETPREEEGESVAGFPVVGIVASAGGLDAFKRFFSAMPATSGMAFVLIPHLDPTRDSMMVELVSRQTAMPVSEATEGARVAPDHVYVIPPNRYLAMEDGVLHLAGPVERGPTTSIDGFLRSLAGDQQERAICIVLSGTSTHGSLGLKAVKANGGMAMVQDPQTAEYSRMPQAAIATGLADFVLPAEEMPAALVKYVQHYFSGERPAAVVETPEGITQVLALLRARSKFDFRAYRKRMLLRRVLRRMGLAHLNDLPEYVNLLRSRPEEVEQLSKDLLISVTSFFRDPEMYQVLEAQILPELLRGRSADAPVRVWVPGCATGEEAYSIAMVLTEQLAAAQKTCPLQVFATDVDADALEVARRGVYPETIVGDVGPDRIARFFVRCDDHSLQVNKQLRETVLFAQQNILSDAPFSRIDLVSCRNLLIYLEPEVQQKIILLLHFALNEGGYLVLGPSETIGRQLDMFEPMSKKWRIYRRVGPLRRERVEFPILGKGRHNEGSLPQAPSKGLRIPELAQQVLLEEYAPACVVINRNYDVLYYHGPTALYLQQPPGMSTHELMALAAPGLRSRLRAAVHKAFREQHTAIMSGGHRQWDSKYVPVRVTARPMGNTWGGLLLVTFQDETAHPSPGEPGEGEASDESLVHQLERELKTTREELQSTIEELESSNEELKASNEEVMSMNEELQSANEELETSKEELQSLNEELSTVNNQLQDKVDELESVNNDMANLLNSADIATVFLDVGLRIKRFTPAATRLFNLIAGDLGRPIGDITRRFEDPDLPADLAAVLDDLAPRSGNVQGEKDRWYLRQITPYRTMDNRIEGVVISFADVTQLMRAEREARRLAEELERRVAERTAELEKQIRDRQQAEELARQRQAELAHMHRLQTAGELATALAHELNQPLASIAAYGEAELRQIRRGALDRERVADSLEKIGNQAQRAAMVIRELRGFLAKHGGVKVACDVNALVKVAVELVEADARSQGAAVTAELEPGLPQVMAEQVQIEQVVVNLLRNGVEAVRETGRTDGKVTVRTGRDEDGRVWVTVRDNGPGVSADELKRVFEPFYTTRTEGLGMGLCISRTIVEAHGGRIWIEAGDSGVVHFNLPALK